jgi:hypothetical protein
VADLSSVADKSAVVDPIQKLLQTLIGGNYEQPISTEIIWSKDPLWRISPPWWIKSCKTPGVPAEGRYTRGKLVTRHLPIRRGGLNISGN